MSLLQSSLVYAKWNSGACTSRGNPGLSRTLQGLRYPTIPMTSNTPPLNSFPCSTPPPTSSTSSLMVQVPSHSAPTSKHPLRFNSHYHPSEPFISLLSTNLFTSSSSLTFSALPISSHLQSKTGTKAISRLRSPYWV